MDIDGDICGQLEDTRGSLWIFVDLCGSLWIFVDLCGSLWIFVDIASSLIYMLVGLIKKSQGNNFLLSHILENCALELHNPRRIENYKNDETMIL